MRARLAGLKHNWEAWALAGLLLVHVVLGVYWSMAIPIWEAHDEDGHWFFVRLLATEHRLPRPGERSTSPNDEMHQPPLYYLLAAVPVSFVDLSDGLMPHYNPYMGWGPDQGGFSRVVHDPVAERWPYHGTVLAIHLARWVSVLIGALGLVFTFLTAKTLFPEQPWIRWGAVVIHACWPQFRFSTAVINNDIMVATCVGAVSWLLVRLMVVRPLKAVDLLALGGACGAALLSKNTALGVVPLVGIVAVARIAGAAPAARKRLAAGMAAAALLGAAVGGWWFIQNYRSGAGIFGGKRTGQWAWQALQALAHLRQWDLTLSALNNGLFSLWASFGWSNLALPAPYYVAASIWAGLGLLGLVMWLFTATARTRVVALAVLAATAVSVAAAPLLLFLRIAQTAAQARADLPGRYLLGTLPALSVLISLGWTHLLRGRVRAVGWTLIWGSLCLLATLAPALYIQPVYKVPRVADEAQAAEYRPLHAMFGGFAELVGYRIKDRFVDPGGTLQVSLLWRALARTDTDQTLAVQVFEGQHTLVGEAHRFPGRGTLATTTWQPGVLFSEDVAIPVRSDNDEGHLAWIEVSFYDPNGLLPVEVSDASGHRLGASARLGLVKIRGTPEASAPVPAESVQFGPAIRLAGGQAWISQAGTTQSLELRLQWAAAERQEVDYTVSVQLRDSENRIISQVDGQPRAGTYPTSFWEPGEVIEDAYALPLPPDLPEGTHTLYVCLYDLATLKRLPVVDPEGGGQPNDEIALCSLNVGQGRSELRAEQRLVEIIR